MRPEVLQQAGTCWAMALRAARAKVASAVARVGYVCRLRMRARHAANAPLHPQQCQFGLTEGMSIRAACSASAH